MQADIKITTNDAAACKCGYPPLVVVAWHNEPILATASAFAARHNVDNVNAMIDAVNAAAPRRSRADLFMAAATMVANLLDDAADGVEARIMMLGAFSTVAQQMGLEPPQESGEWSVANPASAEMADIRKREDFPCDNCHGATEARC